MKRLAFGMIAALIGGLAVAAPVGAGEDVTKAHGVSLFESLGYGPDFPHFNYVDPDAPEGGVARMEASGDFDTLNQFIIKGSPAEGIGLIYDTLLVDSLDEPSTMYGLIAETVEYPADKSWVIFNLRPAARWHDGTATTAEDVVFSLRILKEKGRPFYRFYYANVTKAEVLSPHRVKFTFGESGNRELPLILGQLPVLPKHYWQDRDFASTTLAPPLGSGPYRVAEVEPGRSITYTRVADYWGKDLPVNRGQNNFDRISIEYFRDDTVSLEAFKAGVYDFRLENTAKLWATAYDVPAVKDGRIVKETIPHERPTGMQGYVINTRRDMFADRRVRKALTFAFDFEWTNKNLFYGQYTRTESYFSNSELAARGEPSVAEFQLLDPYRDELPEAVFTEPYAAPSTAPPGSLRGNLRTARRLLQAAGWEIRDGVLRNAETGEKMEIEILLGNPAFERITGPYIRNLEKLGVQARMRVVDASQYQRRLDTFDFDMTVAVFPQSASPGNEQRDFWGSEAADRQGSRNLAGIESPVVDALIEKIVYAPDRAALVTACRALDRVLLRGYYVVPHWHINAFRIVYWDKFERPQTMPTYSHGFPTIWWYDPAKAKMLKGGNSAQP